MDLQTLNLFAIGAIALLALAFQVKQSPVRKMARRLAGKNG